MKPLTCIAVDDEPLALNLLVSYIRKTPSLELKGTFTNALNALKALGQETVDVVFLDIRMNDLSGLELARALDQYRTAGDLRIIFTTAYDQYALESYKVEALDYLLKPFSFSDFSQAVEKAFRYYDRNRVAATSSNPKNDEPKYLYLKVNHQVVRISLDEILYVESDRDYVKVYLENKPEPLVCLTSMKAVEDKLPSRDFMRIHRSFLVALNKIRTATKGTVEIAGRTIAVTDQYREDYLVFFAKWQ